MASPRERDYRSSAAARPSSYPSAAATSYANRLMAQRRQSSPRSQPSYARQPSAQPPISYGRQQYYGANPAQRSLYGRPYYTDVPAIYTRPFVAVPPVQPLYYDYIYVDRLGWVPRWYPYWDSSWSTYWWRLYDQYGGASNPEYAKYARDAYLRRHARQLGLVVSGSYDASLELQPYGIGSDNHSLVRDQRTVAPSVQVPQHMTAQRPHYQHPHYYYGDYITVEGAWWPRWFPYWDAGWNKYWWQLYYYYGGDAHRDYAEYARDMALRSYAKQLGWL